MGRKTIQHSILRRDHSFTPAKIYLLDSVVPRSSLSACVAPSHHYNPRTAGYPASDVRSSSCCSTHTRTVLHVTAKVTSWIMADS